MSVAKLCRLKCMLPTWTILATPWLSVNHFNLEPDIRWTNETKTNTTLSIPGKVWGTLRTLKNREHSVETDVNIRTRNMTSWAPPQQSRHNDLERIPDTLVYVGDKTRRGKIWANDGRESARWGPSSRPSSKYTTEWIPRDLAMLNQWSTELWEIYGADDNPDGSTVPASPGCRKDLNYLTEIGHLH